MANVEIDGANSIVYTDKLDPKTGTALEIGTSGDTITIPSGATITNSGTATGFGGGKINQVVQTAKTDTFTSTTTLADTAITGMTVDITPAASSSKVLVTFALAISNADHAVRMGLQLFRDTTQICLGDADGDRSRGAVGGFVAGGTNSGTANDSSGMQTQTFLDSPSTTSAITYSLKFRQEGGGTFYLNRLGQDTDNANVFRGVSTITAIEVLA